MAQFETSDGIAIVYDDLGPRDGVPVVLCHGLAAAGEQMAADAAYFAADGYRVLVPDLRGHGRSGKPQPVTAAGLSVARLANDMLQMLDHAGIGPVHWVGNSLGGIVALEMVGMDAGRFRTLTTFGTAYKLTTPAWGADAIRWGYRVLGGGGAGRLMGLVTTPRKSARPLIARLVAAMDPAVVAMIADGIRSYDRRGALKGSALPVMILRGARDTLVNGALGPTLAAMKDRADFVLVDLPEAGHCANLDTPEAFRMALKRFWDGRQTRTG